MKTETAHQTFQRGEYPPPISVLNAALSRITADGTVMIFDEDEQIYFESKKAEPVELHQMSDSFYELHLIQVSRSIYRTVSNIASWPDKTDRWLECLAVYLATYCHHPEFLEEAISLGKVDRNILFEPHLA